jgi:hypothetical protein
MVYDTFTEAGAGTQELDTHTPDEDVPGDGWTDDGGSILLNQTTDEAESNENSGNRYSHGSLGTVEMDIICDMRVRNPGGTSFVGPKCRARVSSVGTLGAEGGFDFLTPSSTDDQWFLGDDDVNDSTIEAYPGDHTVKLECRGDVVKLFVDSGSGWVEKATITQTSDYSARTYAGIALLDFLGAGRPNVFGDNYEAWNMDPVAPIDVQVTKRQETIPRFSRLRRSSRYDSRRQISRR